MLVLKKSMVQVVAGGTMSNSWCMNAWISWIDGSQLKKRLLFPSYYYHEIYKVEAVGLKNYNYTWKFTFFVNMYNLDHFLKN